MTIAMQNLTIRGESVQSLYATYLKGGFLVNRRYQRKLVWTIDEKQKFVDSLNGGYPVPLFLLTETSTKVGVVYEIIDGMQRLNAMFAFLEGEFALNDSYFDLNTIPETKALLDGGKLVQKTPVHSPDLCRAVVTYQIPLSVSRSKTSEEIDEVFRRINSYGRHLSKQELRQAGATCGLADVVRKLGSAVRGDTSARDQLELSAMKEISIASAKLPYGISVDDVFWVANNILTRDQVRESKDEEVIAEILAYCILMPKPPANSQILDEYYGVIRSREGPVRFAEVEAAVQKHGPAQLAQRYLSVHDEIRSIVAESEKPFNILMFKDAGARVPRYFQVIFLAFYQLIVNEGMQVADRRKLIKALDGVGKNMNIAEGGNWSAENRQTNVDAVAGIIKKAFKRKGKVDAAIDSWVTELENILIQSKTENNLYDFKQGLHALAPPHGLEAGVIPKIAKTLSAMVNFGKGATGYVIVGITDEEKTANYVMQQRGLEAVRFNAFYVLGVEHEAADKVYKKGLDSYIQKLTQDLSAQPISAVYRDQILRNLRVVSYFGRHVVVLKAEAIDEPCSFDGKFYERHGPNVIEINGEALKDLFKRF